MKTKTFTGKYIGAMPKLLAEGYTPVTMQTAAKHDLNRDTYVDTCDGIAYNGKGKIKILLDCKMLKSVTLKTKLVNGSIQITPAQYKKIKGKEFDKSKLKLNKNLSKAEALKHPIWKALLPDKKIREAHIEKVFQLEDEAMAVWLSNPSIPQLRALCLNGVGGGQGSGAYGRDHLDGDVARLVGVRKVKQ